jgi:hypothetical protein
MKCPALSATIAIALCLVSLPTVALVSEGTHPSIFERHNLPQWPDNPAISALDGGLPIMTLRSVGLLQPQTLPASASVEDHASRTLTALVVRRRMFTSLRRISAHRAIYAHFKIPSRLRSKPHDTAVFVGGLY